MTSLFSFTREPAKALALACAVVGGEEKTRPVGFSGSSPTRSGSCKQKKLSAFLLLAAQGTNKQKNLAKKSDSGSG